MPRTNQARQGIVSETPEFSERPQCCEILLLHGAEAPPKSLTVLLPRAPAVVKKCQSCRGLVSPTLRGAQTPGVLTTSKHNLATFQHLTPSLAIAIHPFPLRARTGRQTRSQRTPQVGKDSTSFRKLGCVGWCPRRESLIERNAAELVRSGGGEQRG
jgi:hypothetical protein